MTGYAAALRSAYDYYPFGMLMPGRHVRDTSSHCITISQPKWVEYRKDSCWTVDLWDVDWHHASDDVIEAIQGDEVQLEAPTAGSWVSMDLLTAPGKQMLQLEVSVRFAGKESRIEVQELRGGKWYRIGSAKLSGSLIRIPIMATKHQVRVWWYGPFVVRFKEVCVEVSVWEQQEVLVDVCSPGKDGYRFGYNGQEKVNEVAGVGNHNTAEFWEYDTRLGRRLNLDPVDQISISNYGANGLNPIMNTDPLGNVFNKWDTKSPKKEYRFNGSYPTNRKYFADESNYMSFYNSALELATDNIIFAQVYNQLAKSKNLYTIKQEYTNTANYDDKTKSINMAYRGVGKDAHIPKTEVFEEVFHAGQDEYYSARGIKRSHLEDEVEAKVADIISGHQDDAISKEYSSIKNYFKTGKKDKGFDKDLDDLIKDVDKLYNDYDNTKDNQWRKNNDPKQVDKENVLNYLETLTPATNNK